MLTTNNLYIMQKKNHYEKPTMEVLSLAPIQEILGTTSVSLVAPALISGDDLASPSSEYNPW
jgi:hypothetical protein